MTEPVTLDDLMAQLDHLGATAMEWKERALKAEAQVKVLYDENFTLAAGVCDYRSGDDHGNPWCLLNKRSIPF